MMRSVRIAPLAGLALIVGVATLATRPSVTNPPTTEPVANTVISFANHHPEWAVLQGDRRDTTPLSFGHARHLDRNLRDAPPGGLRCVDCHVPDASGRYMQPISFDAHCRECHAANLGTINVAEGVVPGEISPHGSPAEIGRTVDRKLGEWAQRQPENLVIAPVANPAQADGQTSTESPPAEPSTPRGRRRPSDREKPKAEVPVFKSIDERDAWIVEQRAAVLETLGSKSRCGYCHTSIVAPEMRGDLFEVHPPNIPDRWLPRAHFSHLSHEMLRCNECHTTANESHDTSHILLPTIDSCRECHAPAANGVGGAPDGCVLCHTYHQEPPPSQGLRVVEDLHRK